MHWLRPLLLLLPLALPAQAQPTLQLLVYPNPGVFDVAHGDEVTGPGAVLLHRLAEVTGLPLKVQAVPAARALMMIAQLPAHCAVGVPRSPEREPLFRWAGLMASGSLMLYGRADDKREVAGADDLRGSVIAAQRESQPLAWLHEHGLNAYEVNDTLTGLRMLRAGRVDFWLVNELPARYVVQRSGGTPPRPLREFGRIDLYLACHHDLAPATAERLSQGFEQLRRNGELVEFGLR